MKDEIRKIKNILNKNNKHLINKKKKNKIKKKISIKKIDNIINTQKNTDNYKIISTTAKQLKKYRRKKRDKYNKNIKGELIYYYKIENFNIKYNDKKKPKGIYKKKNEDEFKKNIINSYFYKYSIIKNKNEW